MSGVVAGDPKNDWVMRVLGINVGAAQVRPARSVSLAGVARASMEWRKLCATVRGEIETLKTDSITALEQSDRYDDDEITEAQQELVRLDEIFALVSPAIIDTMDDAINAQPDARAGVLRDILKQVAAAEAEIGGSQTIRDVEGNGLRKVDLARPALGALAGLRREIEPLIAA